MLGILNRKTKEVYDKIFYPPCFPRRYDFRTTKCRNCKVLGDCQREWKKLWVMTFFWILRLRKVKTNEN